MSNTVTWQLRLSVNDGKLDEFRDLMTEMVASTRHEEGALSYEWYISDDGSACDILERYTDSDAVMAHLGAFGEKFAERFMACVTPTGFSVYGEPDDNVRDALAGFGPAYMSPFGGFVR